MGPAPGGDRCHLARECAVIRVSVVIATYQRRDSCVRAVESALAQTLSPFEVLVCDDGSTDGTEYVMRKWATRESRLNYLRLPANTGTPAVARNIGVDAASGDWVAFLDDDDTWVPAKLERQLRYVDEADIIASDAYLPDGRKYLRLERNARDIPRTQLLRTNPVIVSSAIAKREMVVDVGGFPEERRLAGVADYCLWMKLADAGARFFIVSEPLVLYNNAGTDRLSRAVLRGQTALARHCVIRWVRRPADRAIATSAAFHVALATRVALRRLAGSPLLRSLREN